MRTSNSQEDIAERRLHMDTQVLGRTRDSIERNEVDVG